MAFIRHQVYIRGHYAQADPWALAGHHQQAHAAYFTQPSVSSDQRRDNAVVAVDMGASRIA